MSRGRGHRKLGERYGVALLAAVVVMSVTSAVGLVAPATAWAGPAPALSCAAAPTGEGCTLTAISLDTSALVPCATSCQGDELPTGQTVDLVIDGTYNDGSEGPLSVPAAGPTGPQATWAVAPQPAGAITLTGVVNGVGAVDEVQLAVAGPTSSPAVVQVSYDGLQGASASLNALNTLDQATCGQPGQPACSSVNGALVDVSVLVLTATASTPGPLSGAVVDIVQAGTAAGAQTSDQPCYPETATGPCGPPPDGDPATASPSTCTTDSTGACPLTAMWDGTEEGFTGSDVVSLSPPPGYTVTGVSGCSAVTGAPGAPACALSPPDWSAPLSVVFDVAANPVLTVNVTGPAEPCNPLYCQGDQDIFYDNDQLNGISVTITPTGSTPGSPATCVLENGAVGYAAFLGQPSYCTVDLPPGTYDVSLPPTIPTPDSEVGIPLAYPVGTNPEPVSLSAGAPSEVNLSTAYEPLVTVEVAGPLEPSCTPATCPADELVYDNDVVDGTPVTVTPAPGTPGSPQTCVVTGGYAGGSGYGQPAWCAVAVPPGTYTLSVPATISTPNSEVGIPLVYVSAPLSQSVTVTAGDAPEVLFATTYEPSISVSLGGPLDPTCDASMLGGVGTAGSCPAGDQIFDNDAVDGTTATVTPIDGTAGSAQTCEVNGGEPSDSAATEEATCLVGVAPGTYSVSVPSRIAPDPDYGWGFIDVTGSATEVVNVTSGAPITDVNFNTTYPTMQDVGSGSGSARTTDGLVTATGNGGSGILTVAEYASDPDGPATFNTSNASNDYIYVGASPGSYFNQVSFTVCGLHDNPAAMYWWASSFDVGSSFTGTSSASTGQWDPVSPSGTVTVGKPGCLTALLSLSSTPSVGGFTGAVFAVPLSLSAQRVSFTSANPSPAAVGSTYQPKARSSSGLPVEVSLDAALGKPACTLSASGLVTFTEAGTCTVQADQDGNDAWAAASATQAITVFADRPVAVGASYSTSYGHTLDVSARAGVLSRGTLRGATIVSHSRPAHGTLTLRPNGSFVYVPRPSFSGTDSFTFTVKNSSGQATATVTIHVGAAPRKPARVKHRRR